MNAIGGGVLTAAGAVRGKAGSSFALYTPYTIAAATNNLVRCTRPQRYALLGGPLPTPAILSGWSRVDSAAGSFEGGKGGRSEEC